MRVRTLHSWDVTPRQARAIQERLRGRVVRRGSVSRMRTVAGADMAVDPVGRVAWAAVLVFRLPDLDLLEESAATGRLRFPYVPGLLSFREAPVLLQAFRRLRTVPDVVLVDGQGCAHPRRFGIACHLGLLLGVPTVGCAKSRLIGEFDPPGRERGSVSPLFDGAERIGSVVRTRSGVNPVFVSPGHRVGFRAAEALVLRCGDGFRIPRPTREADRRVGELKRSASP